MISLDKIPSSIYRLQMDSHVPLKKAIQLIPYLFELGIEGVYCSPLFKSHSNGYDVSDPHCLNPVLGTEEDFELFCQELKMRGMQQILDVVPNHMGIKENHWWNDVLQHGPSSPFAFFFDIRWNAQGKILLPLLSTFYGTALENNDLQLIWDESFWIQYFEYRLPIANESRYFQRKMREINENKALLHQLLEEQFYRLSFWKVGEREINYRRFFNINDLVAIHMEKEWVFNLHHRWILELLASEKVAGIRVDHPDGLYDPGLYFERLRNKGASLIWAEKIVDKGEELPENWSVDGTVGYDFLNLLSGLFIQKKNEKRMTDMYEKFIQEKASLKEIKYSRRKNYINNHMVSEIRYLSSLLDKISEKNLRWRDLTETDFSQALIEIISCFPVYRTYRRPGENLRKKDREILSQAMREGKKREKELYAFDFIRGLFLKKRLDELESNFIGRFQQLTAAVMAKGLEDSTFYIYNRLISLNEVGGSPSHFGTSKTEFHRFNRRQRQKFPFSLLPSSTHDTKYSQDARLRIHKLTEFPALWEQTVREAATHNAPYKTKIQGVLFPDRNTEYFLYQMLIALGRKDKSRLWQCLQKAIREAGLYTSWKKIDVAYEAAVKRFLEKMLKTNHAFFTFQRKIARDAALSSLCALVLKIGSCGIVNIYQGDEILNPRLMDPDNRRAVPFGKKYDLKTEITRQGLRFRRMHKDLFLKGNYIPLKTNRENIAFLRQYRGKFCIVSAQRFSSPKKHWIILPPAFAGKRVKNLFTGEEMILEKNKKCAVPSYGIFFNGNVYNDAKTQPRSRLGQNTL